MGVIIVKKKDGRTFSGEELAKRHWIRADGGDIYPFDSFWGGRFAYEPVAKMLYLEAAFNTLGRDLVNRRRKEKGAKFFRRIVNLERRLVKYIPNCTGVSHDKDWRNEDVPASMRPYYPEFRYGEIKKAEAEAAVAFLKEEDIDDFEFVIDSRYVVIFEASDGAWEAMKAAGLIDLDEIECERGAG